MRRDAILCCRGRCSFRTTSSIAPEFSGALAAEHSSDDPMFRDTDQGLRSLQKKGGERVLVDKSVKRIKSLIAGAMYGGTFNFPIPFLGISIADFDFHHTGAQLSTFFAGPILVSDLSKQYRPKFRLALDLALYGLPGENRIYSNNTELLQGEVWTWEQTTGLRASWQASTHLSVTASSYFAYDNFLRTSQCGRAIRTAAQRTECSSGPRNKIQPRRVTCSTRRGHGASASTGGRSDALRWPCLRLDAVLHRRTRRRKTLCWCSVRKMRSRSTTPI